VEVDIEVGDLAWARERERPHFVEDVGSVIRDLLLVSLRVERGDADRHQVLGVERIQIRL